MTDFELLEKALYSSAIIQQPHALKAYLSAKYLYEYLGKTPEIWVQTSALIEQSEVKVLSLYAKTVEAPAFSHSRIKTILQRGIYPAAYQALWQWYEEKGFQSIFEYYVIEASQHKVYLSHNVTLLLALNCIAKDLKPSYMPVFLDRFTEFVTSTYSGEKLIITEVKTIEINEVLISCLNQFGFFGHNLITLTWILRCKDSLSEDEYISMLSNLYHQANSPLEDPEDKIDLVIWAQCVRQDSVVQFNEKVRRLVFNYTSNLHQVTLADALCFLQNAFPEYTDELMSVATYQCRLLDK